jgi:hypothetical protein
MTPLPKNYHSEYFSGFSLKKFLLKSIIFILIVHCTILVLFHELFVIFLFIYCKLFQTGQGQDR